MGDQLGSPQSIPSSCGKPPRSHTPFLHLKLELGEFLPLPTQEQLSGPRSLSGISGRARVHGTNAFPFQHLLPGQHSCSLWFSIKQTLPASSPAGPGNRAADLGHLGTVPPLYLDFGAKFSICEILCKPRQRGHREVGAGPAGPAVLHHRHSLQTSTVSPPLNAPAHRASSQQPKSAPSPR